MALFCQPFLELAGELLIILHNQNLHLRFGSIRFISEELMSSPWLGHLQLYFPDFRVRTSQSRLGQRPSRRIRQYAPSSLGVHRSYATRSDRGSGGDGVADSLGRFYGLAAIVLASQLGAATLTA